MLERIGKYSLIFGAVLTGTVLMAGIALKGGLLPTPQGNMIYTLLMIIPLATVLLSTLAGWLVAIQCAKGDKTRAKGTDRSDNKVSVFFKAYLYLWAIYALGIFVFGALMAAERVGIEDTMLLTASIYATMIWLTSVVVALLIWAVFMLWKINEFVGVIVAVIALGILTGSVALTGHLYGHDSRMYQRYVDGGYEDYVEGEYPVAVPEQVEEYVEEEESEEEEVLEPADSRELAFRFARYKANFEGSGDPVSLLFCWANNFGDEYYDSSTSIFVGPSDFDRCRVAFHSIYNLILDSNSSLDELFDYYKNDFEGEKVGTKTFRTSGAKVLVKALLATYDDIYNRENSEEVLEGIYRVMSEGVPSEYSSDILVSYRRPKLAGYFDDATLEKIRAYGENKSWCSHYNDWCHDFVTVWAYSFWARRHNAGVDEMAHTIVKAVDKMY